MDAPSIRGATSQALRAVGEKASDAMSAAKETAAGALAYGEEKLGLAGGNGSGAQASSEGEGDTAPPGSPKDEVDASPEEQFVRHHVELDTEKLPSHRAHPHPPGPLSQLKKGKSAGCVGAGEAPRHKGERGRRRGPAATL